MHTSTCIIQSGCEVGFYCVTLRARDLLQSCSWTHIARWEQCNADCSTCTCISSVVFVYTLLILLVCFSLTFTYPVSHVIRSFTDAPGLSVIACGDVACQYWCTDCHRGGGEGGGGTWGNNPLSNEAREGVGVGRCPLREQSTVKWRWWGWVRCPLREQSSKAYCQVLATLTLCQ
jgi:hypothetical protein